MSDPAPVSETRRAWTEAPTSMFMSTCAGIGHLPGGPGTYAAILFTPLIVWMSDWSLPFRVALLIIASAASMYWSHHAGRALREHDSNRIVIDEVIGVWTALVWFDDLGWLAALVGLVLFRILDTTKPPPAKSLDENGDDGISVVADDIVAGLWTVPAVWLVRWLWG
ncbi:phosphatidylglycerophosphatase A [Persicimonas caeni]|uniref:Phosphatidylglycerophosphatase A n=1 Tax=Persicimonas caeni TaxID=2292766 RepID=A0A4Y6PRD7_PERCE|nr:phosphatidylglycerophosphatase A [Persicimonas caeni]QDG50904.1 phosphatidylglycerophosphatase A [Persicimonas caeni]QED32125.1 phosphatidylglycerophosphatase A [Persicimonas caeni]